MKAFLALALSIVLLMIPANAFAETTPAPIPGVTGPYTEMTEEEFVKQYQDSLLQSAKAQEEQQSRATILAVSLGVVLAGGGFAAFKALTASPKKGAGSAANTAARKTETKKR
jgi:hypothetical protein